MGSEAWTIKNSSQKEIVGIWNEIYEKRRLQTLVSQTKLKHFKRIKKSSDIYKITKPIQLETTCKENGKQKNTIS